MKICAVVVTYNRLDLLKGTVEKLLNQDRKLDEIIVVDNKSTDGTKEYLETIKNKIVPVYLEKNVGGAGGFNQGIRLAYERGNDYVWVMDDDTYVERNALSKLIEKFDKVDMEKIGFLCSNVLFKDGTPCKMNIPQICTETWNENIKNGLVKVKSASFVSLLVSKEIIKEFGLPIKEFFIWADDVEFTKRISQKYDGFMVTDSIVKHYMTQNDGIDILKEKKDRVGRYFYAQRNWLYISKKSGKKEMKEYMVNFIKLLVKIVLFKNEGKYEKVKVIMRGFFQGLKFNPKIEYVDR